MYWLPRSEREDCQTLVDRAPSDGHVDGLTHDLGLATPRSISLLAWSPSYRLTGRKTPPVRETPRTPDVKPRVLWWLVYLVPVVAGCDCSWRWVSGAQAASCSAGVRIPMAECGRVVPVPVDPLGGGEHGRR